VARNASLRQGGSSRRRRVVRVVGWILLLTAIIGSAVPIGLTGYIKAQGTDVGPDQAVTWPSDQPAVIVPHGESPSVSPECTVTPQHGEPRQESMRWGALTGPPASGTATITCEHAGVFVTGADARILSTTYNLMGPIALMLFIGLFGLMGVAPRLFVIVTYLPTLWDYLSGKVAREEEERKPLL
jgi:hypothetical protein